MALRNRFIDNSGYSNNTSAEANRLANKDGSYNVHKAGIPFLERYSTIHVLLKMKRWKFNTLLLSYYLMLNTFFACIYYVVGMNHFGGIEPGHEFMQAFFFSAQTITTVGYGHIYPTANITNVIAAIESFTGILTFAVITGLVYGRFSQPRAYLKFSYHALVAPYKEGKAIMLRFGSYKNNNLTEATAQIICSLHMEENGQMVTRFFNLPLEISKINILATSWTLVHPITEESPLWGLTEEDFKERKFEMVVHIQGIDDQLFHVVQQKTSYVASELVFNAKFKPMLSRSTDGSKSVVDYELIDAYDLV